MSEAEAIGGSAPLTTAPPKGGGRSRWRQANLVVGAALVAMVVLAGVVSFVWTPYSAIAVDTSNTLRPPDGDHWLGTDQYGRDLFSMVMVGARNTLYVGIIAVAIAIAVGIPTGGLAAVRRGWTEEVVMRGSDIVYAFPAVLLAIMLSATLGPSTFAAMVAIGIAYAPVFARITRGAALQAMTREFVTAARAYGRGRTFVFVRHVLPNISSVLIVQATVMFALAILAEAALSYLGIGTQPPTPSWGRMLREAQTFLTIQPSLAVWPGLAIALSVLGFNLLGDGLRDALDPKLGDRRP